MSAKVIGIIVAVVLIIVIIVVVMYRKSFFSKKSSENDSDEKEEEEVDNSSYEEEYEYDENEFQEENVTSGNGSSYEVDEQEEETELQPNEWLAYRNHWNLEGDKVISKSGTFLKKEDVNSSELDDDSKIQITVGMEATYIRQWQLNDDYYVVNYETSEDYESEMEDIDFETEIEDVDLETEMEGRTPINSETSSSVIDNILEKEGWEISFDMSISDKSGEWRNLFH